MNLAVVDTATNLVRVFAGRKKVTEAKFNRSLDAGELEAMRVDPIAFLTDIGVIEPADAPGVA